MDMTPVGLCVMFGPACPPDANDSLFSTGMAWGQTRHWPSTIKSYSSSHGVCIARFLKQILEWPRKEEAAQKKSVITPSIFCLYPGEWHRGGAWRISGVFNCRLLWTLIIMKPIKDILRWRWTVPFKEGIGWAQGAEKIMVHIFLGELFSVGFDPAGRKIFTCLACVTKVSMKPVKTETQKDIFSWRSLWRSSWHHEEATKRSTVEDFRYTYQQVFMGGTRRKSYD